MTTYSLDSLEHQATRAFFRRLSGKARRRRQVENIIAWSVATAAVSLAIFLLISGF